MTPERKAAIVRLLSTRDENLPEPRHRTEATAGFVHGDPDHRETCPDCLANDRRMFGCETCGGAGWVKKPRSRDPYATEAVLPFGFDGSKHDASHERDRQIEILGQQLRPASNVDELADANAHPYAWERARRQMYRRFDYGPLDAALEQLRQVDDDAYRALHAVYVYGWLTEISASAETVCDRGLAFLDERLPEKIRAPAPPKPLEVRGPMRPEAGATAKAIRDSAMRQRASEGATPAELAVEFRVSIRTVYEAVKAA